MKDLQAGVMSAKSRTRSKFDLLLKTALEERKLDQSIETIEPKSEKVGKPKKKKPKKPKSNEGIINPSFDDGNNFELKPIRRPATNSRNPGATADDEPAGNIDTPVSPSNDNVVDTLDGSSRTDVALIRHDQLDQENEESKLRTDRAARRRHKARKDTESGKQRIPDTPEDPRYNEIGYDSRDAGPSRPRLVVSDSIIETGSGETVIQAPKVPSRKKKSKSEQLVEIRSESLVASPSPERSNLTEGRDGIVDAGENEATKRTVTTLPVSESGPRLSGDDGRILSVKVHRVDRLRVNLTIKHPLVRIHVIDGSSGTYFNRTRRTSSAAAPPGESSSADFIQPAMTQPFDIKTKRSFVPVWEEEVLFPANFGLLTEQDSNVIVFFEILDFVSMSRAQNQYRKLGADSGWYRLAWAFLKLVGSNGTSNTNFKAQLQLYHFPKQPLRPVPRVLDKFLISKHDIGIEFLIYQYWSSNVRDPYPSTLYVTVNSHAPISAAAKLPTGPPLATSHRNCSSPTSSANDGRIDPSTLMEGANSLTNHADGLIPQPSPKWSRLPGQSCKIPNMPHMNFPATTTTGCFAVNFSPNGRLCACACHKESSTEILLYEVISGDLLTRLGGHHGLIYSLQFSSGSELLLSPSSDTSTRVWKMEGRSSTCSQILPHPSYVYAAIFHPHNSAFVATGCYDTVVRLWRINGGSTKYGQLVQELEGHRSRVNALCFDEEGVLLFSGDGHGVIRQWSSRSGKHLDGEGRTNDWSLRQEIRIPEVKDVSITNFFLHPTLNRLFVQSLDCVIRAIDVESSRIVQEYRSFLNIHELVRGCITPCGNFVFCGSEDHCVYVWNALTGARVTVYDDLPFGQTVHCVAYHPLDHIVAFASYRGGCPVLIYNYNVQAVQKGLSLVQPAHGSSSTSLLLSKLAPSTAPSVSGTLHPLVASTPLKRSGEISSHLSETANSGTCLEKIMRKLDSVFEATNLTDRLHGTSGGYASSEMLDYGDESMLRTSYEHPNLRSYRNGDKDHWPSRTSDGVRRYEDNKERPKNVSAMLTKSGELAFLSASDESLDKLASTAKRREKRRQRTRYNFDDDESS